MGRFFYTDPLAAAWMAKHFGMEFTCQGSGYDPQQGKPFGVEVLYHFLDTGYASNLLPIRVRPDSLHLLEPREGDLLRLYLYTPAQDDEANAVMTGVFLGDGRVRTWLRNPRDGSIDHQQHGIGDHDWRIIQRNGIPFMWPQREP